MTSTWQPPDDVAFYREKFKNSGLIRELVDLNLQENQPGYAYR